MGIGREDPFIPGSILNADGSINKIVGEFDFAVAEPRFDETVYTLFETIVPDKRTGTTLGLQFVLRPGWIMCTFQIPGGTKDDVGLVFLRGMVAPPEGTRFALRMLRPEYQPGGNDAEKETENQSRETSGRPIRDAEVQEGDAQVGERPEGQEPEAGDRHRVVGERAESSETPKEETLGAALANNPEARAIVEHPNGTNSYDDA